MRYGKTIGIAVLVTILFFPTQFFTGLVYAFIGIALILLIIETALYVYIAWVYVKDWFLDKFYKDRV